MRKIFLVMTAAQLSLSCEMIASEDSSSALSGEKITSEDSSSALSGEKITPKDSSLALMSEIITFEDSSSDSDKESLDSLEALEEEEYLVDNSDESEQEFKSNHEMDQQDFKKHRMERNRFCSYNPKHQFTVGVEFLWWKMDEQGADYAVSKDIPVYFNGTFFEDGLVKTLKEIKFPWEPGVRAHLGYQFPRDRWDLFAEYTYYHAARNNRANLPSGPDGVLCGTFVSQTPVSVQSASSHFKFNYNLLDVDISRTFSLSKQISLDFLFGVRSAWMKHDWHIHYIATVTGNPQPSSDTKVDWKFSGAGGNIGLMTNWCLFDGFSIYGKYNIAALYGEFHEVFTTNVTPTNGPINDLHRKVDRTTWNNQIAIGLSWFHSWEPCDLAVHIGYELTTWEGLNEHFRYPFFGGGPQKFDKVRALDTGSLNIQGLTAGVDLRF